MNREQDCVQNFIAVKNLHKNKNYIEIIKYFQKSCDYLSGR